VLLCCTTGCCAVLQVHALRLPACLLPAIVNASHRRRHWQCHAAAEWHALTAPCFWACAGVMDSVSKGYLKNMYFGISQDAAGTNLLEVRAGSARGLWQGQCCCVP
jgi:hypothetical protein